jgi:hypothetical protein
MDHNCFDRLSRAISRRTGLGILSAFGLGGVAAMAEDVAAKKKRKHQRKHKKRRCPQSRRCGKTLCCPPGEICAGAVCVIGQGACATGADSCEAGFFVLCAENCLCLTTTEGDTRCAQVGISGGCGSCTSSADCAKYGAGTFCAAAGPGCGCQAGEGFCAWPCFD